MELELFKKGLDYAKKRRRWVYALAALGVTSYGAYKVYHSPAVVKKRPRMVQLLSALVTVIEMVSHSAEAIGIISKDFKEFIQSDSDQLPKSLKQISKISTSDELSESLVKITRALTVGILQGYQYETAKNGVNGFPDRVIDKFLSDAGSGFASVVVGSFAKSMVMAFYSIIQHNGNNANSGSSLDIDSGLFGAANRLVDLLSAEKCRALIGDCVQSFVSTAVAVYLDKTMHINTYDEVFSGLTNPKHEAQVRDMLVSICKGAVEAFVRTSHHVLTKSYSSDADMKLNNSSRLQIDFEESPTSESKALIAGGQYSLSDNKLKGMEQFDENQYGGWSNNKNKRLVLALTGRVTLGTVRYFLELLMEKTSDCVRRSADIIREEVFDKGVEAFQYVNRKSSAVVTLCLSLCLQILNSPWILVNN